MGAGDVSTAGTVSIKRKQPTLRRKRGVLFGQNRGECPGHVLEFTGVSLDLVHIAGF